MDTLYDLYQFFCQHSGATTISSFLIAVAIEKSKTIKFNPFSFVGDLLTGRVMRTVGKNQRKTDEKMEEIANSVKDLESRIDEVKEENKILSEKMEKAREDSIDRYNESCQKYEELKEDMRYEIKASDMKQYRVDFFRFEEGVKEGASYTKEHWHNMRNKVLEYQHFCEDNDQFINSECEDAMNTILSAWELHPWENNNE